MEYIAVHDLDTPKSKRDGKFIKNSMWTINEKIIEEANKGLNGKVIVNIPDFERQFFGYLQSGDKPYNAILELQKEERRNVRDELEKIANGSLSEKYEREITKVSDYKKLEKVILMIICQSNFFYILGKRVHKQLGIDFVFNADRLAF